jgi:hypothetical protein
MATAAQISEVRLNIDDIDSGNYNFTDNQISDKIDVKNSVAHASWQLLIILKTRLRKKLLRRDATGDEITEVQTLREQIELYDSLIDKYRNDYYDELGQGTGVIISTNKPTIAGGDV